MHYRKRWPKGTWMRLASKDTLRALMEQRHIGQGRLARYAGCHKSFISHLTAGRSNTCGPQLATRIAEALDVPLEVLFEVHQSSTTSENDPQSGKPAAIEGAA